MTNMTVNAQPAPANRSWRIILVLIAAIGIILGIIWAGSTREKSMPFVAAVNDNTITLNQFEAEVALQEVKYELTGREQAVDKPALLNRMIGDMLLLEAAGDSGVKALGAETQAEIDAILTRFNVSRAEMTERLSAHGLAWTQFEKSVQEYKIITRYVDDELLAELSLAEKKEALDAWMAAQYQAAELRFDQDFLDSINTSPSDLAVMGSNG